MRFPLRPDLHALPRTLLVSGTWLVALAIAAWVAASWYWRLTGTQVLSARPAAVSDPLVAAQDIASRQLFGAPRAPVVAVVETAPPPNLTLIGVSTRWGKLPGFAVVRDGTSPAASFVEGEEITPGTRLVRVLPDAIEIERNGVRERIHLNPAMGGGPAGAAQSPAPPPGPPSEPAPQAEN